MRISDEHERLLSRQTALEQMLEETRLAIKLEVQRSLKLTCSKCGDAKPIGEIHFIQPMWYERPHGCMGGDTWHALDNGTYECAACNYRNNIRDAEILEHKYLFASRTEEYPRRTF